MQILDKILATLSAWAGQLSRLDVWLELSVILAGAGLAWLPHRRWRAYVNRRLGEAERQGLGRAALRGTVRVVFPVGMLLLLLAGRGVLTGLDLRIVLLDIFVPLLLSLAAIRLIVYILRRGFTPSPALRAWEGIILETAVGRGGGWGCGGVGQGATTRNDKPFQGVATPPYAATTAPSAS